MNVVVRGQVKSENSSLPVAVRVSKTRMLKLPNIIINFLQSHTLNEMLCPCLVYKPCGKLEAIGTERNSIIGLCQVINRTILAYKIFSILNQCNL